MLFLTLVSLFLAGASAFIIPPLSVNSGRIVGGVETTIEDRPFSVSLLTSVGSTYFHNCGASILSKNYLLSAAHCKSTSTYNARIGSTSNKVGGVLVLVLTSNFVQHPNYYRPTLDYDIAVLKIESEITFGPTIQAVVLPSSPDPQEGDMTTVSGWGVTSESSPSSPENLRKVDLPAWNNTRCSSVYSFITPRQLCLGGTPQGGTSACFGDSGGPVTFKGVQVALVSGGNSCSAPNIPGIYARLSSVLDWIKEKAELN